MRRRAGIGVGIVTSVVLGWFSNPLPWTKLNAQARREEPVQSKGTANRSQKHPELPIADSCTAYLPPEDTEKASSDASRGEAYHLIDRFLSISSNPTVANSVEYVIALVPDPRHTRLSMFFDRSIASIQDAAQDDGFQYDSSWLPWRAEKRQYSSRDDILHEEESQKARERCPGVMLFRKSPLRITGGGDASETQKTGLYNHGLFVFVVAEQPTGGLNTTQWTNAVQWIGSHADAQPLRVLGPTFSGSLPSLREELSKNRPQSDRPWGHSAIVFSGSVGSCQSIEWFKDQVEHYAPLSGATFKVFQENDELQLFRFLSYLKSRKEDLRSVAIMSEDETAYGGSLEYPAKNECDMLSSFDRYERPVSLFYPRDISALRAAYQAQSIFSSTHLGTEKQTAHTVLSDDLEPEDTERGDTPPTYSSRQTSISQEAELYGAVSFLRAHHAHYVVLRGSNPLDCLFLTRFLHHAFPEGRAVVVGSEILFSRELDTTEFRGSMSLSNFPLLPRLQHWSQVFEEDHLPVHGHRVFSSHTSEGLYIASRFLMRDLLPDREPQDKDVPLGYGTITDFEDPYWLHTDSPLQKAYGSSNTWLAVLGRDGYWPVAMLNKDKPPPLSCEGTDPKTPQTANVPPSTEASMWDCKGHYDRKLSMGMNAPMPWYFAICLSLLLLVSHIYRCSSLAQDSCHLCEAFAPGDDRPSKILIAASTAFAFAISLILIAPMLVLVVAGTPLWEGEIITALVAAPFAMILGAVLVRREARYPFLIGVLLSFAVLFTLFNLGIADAVSYYYRSIHLTDSVSPVVPILFLLMGLYFWAWHNMAGNRLLSAGRPQLPRTSDLCWKYSRASAAIAQRIDSVARPFTFSWGVVASPLLVLVLCAFSFRKNFPVLSFEGFAYTCILNLLFLAVLLLIATGAARLWRVWKQLRRLLVQLARMPLRRTFRALPDISLRSLWAMSGNVPRTQYTFFTRQLDAAARMRDSLEKAESKKLTPEVSSPAQGELGAELSSTIERGNAFSRAYLGNLERTTQWDRETRELIGKCAGLIMKHKLEPAWDKEIKQADCLLPHEAQGTAKDDSEKEKKPPFVDMPLSTDTAVRAGEEFVCLLYVSYIQNVLARMRTIVFSMSALYVAAMLAAAFYPLAPRPSIAIWMLLVLIALGAVVAIVYAGLERDPVLSSITNTETKLGWEFWAKYAAFLLPPLIALLTAQFPEIADTLVRWVQPGLDAVK